MEQLKNYAMKMSELNDLKYKVNENEYNLIFTIISEIANCIKLNINSLSDFRNVSCDLITEKITPIKKIITVHSDMLLLHFNIDPKFSKTTNSGSIVTILRCMLQQINYKLVSRGGKITIIAS